MAVDANGRLRADMDRSSIDATGWQLEKARKSGLNQAQVIGTTLEHLRRGLDVVTVRDDEGNHWAVPAAAVRALQKGAVSAHQQALTRAYEQGINDYHNRLIEQQLTT